MKLLATIVLLCFAPLAAQASGGTSKRDVTLVALEQYACPFWGTCPHYIVAINSDGTGSYLGLEATAKKGSVALKLPPSAFEAIVLELHKIKYFQLHKSYTSLDDGCKQMATDQNSGTFFVVRDGKVKAVDIYWGCQLPGVADNLAKLASLIDRVSGIGPLLGNNQ